MTTYVLVVLWMNSTNDHELRVVSRREGIDQGAFDQLTPLAETTSRPAIDQLCGVLSADIKRRTFGYHKRRWHELVNSYGMPYLDPQIRRNIRLLVQST